MQHLCLGLQHPENMRSIVQCIVQLGIWQGEAGESSVVCVCSLLSVNL